MSLFDQKKKYNDGSLESKLLSQINHNRLPSIRQFKYLKKFLSVKEKWILAASLSVLVITSSLLLRGFWLNHLVVSPKNGGQYIEGTITPPSHINPLFFGLNSTDDDLVSLVYSSLWKRDNNGSLKADLVESFKISDDQKTYTIKITDKARFHSGKKLTTDDVIFTINTIKDPRFKSTWRRYFINVEAEKISDTELKLSLKEPYAAFLEYLSFGILPKDLWQDISPNNISLAELNIKPVGSGPLKFQSLTKDKSGNLRSFNLTRNKDYYHEQTYLDTFSFKIFTSPEELVTSLNDNTVDSVSYLPSSYQKSILAANAYNFNQLKQAQSLAIFFNLKKPELDKKLRQALDYALDKKTIISKVYGNDAELATGPIANFAFAYQTASNDYSFNPTKAKELLASAGWKEITIGSSTTTVLQKNGENLKLELTTTSNLNELQVAELIAQYWSAVGIQTSIVSEEKNTFFSRVIKPKNYSVLLYSIINPLNSDPYAFWHSSQSDDKGYNLSNLSSSKIDRLIEEARLDANTSKRIANYSEFQKIINDEVPAIFLANQNFVYIQSKKIKGFTTKIISSPEDRFDNINEWYLSEKKRLQL